LQALSRGALARSARYDFSIFSREIDRAVTEVVQNVRVDRRPQSVLLEDASAPSLASLQALNGEDPRAECDNPSSADGRRRSELSPTE